MKLPKLAIENFQFTTIIILLLAISGIISLLTMPRSEDPPVEQAAASVVVVYPGTSPVDMEELVVDPLEEAFNELDDLKEIVSRTQDGLAVIRVEFLFGSDPDDKFSEVLQKVNSVRDKLPADILSIETNKFSISDYVNIFQIALVSDSASYFELDREAEALKKSLEKVAGIKKVNIWAVPEKQVRIAFDAQKLAHMRIPFNQLIHAIQSNNANIPGGSIEVGSRQFNIKTSGSYQSLDDIRNTIIHASLDRIVYLKDVAEVDFATEDLTYKARFNGQRAVFVSATQKKETNIFDIMADVRRTVDAYQQGLPESIALAWVFDQSNSVASRLNSFAGNLLQGMLLVGIVLLLVLGLRAALLVMAVIPISILIAMGFLDLSGFGIQQMTITGLVISLGLLVDNAIVVIENITRFIRQGYGFKDAAVLGTQQISWAVVSSTATTVLAFVPIIFMQNTSGDFIRSMPLTVVFTLAASLLISLTLTPFLMSRLTRAGSATQQRRVQGWLERFVASVYRRRLAFALAHQKTTLLLASIVFLGSMSLFPLIGVSFFPKAEKAQLLINIDAPEGTNIEKTDAIARQVEQQLAANSEVAQYATNVGHGNPVIYYNVMTRNQAANQAQLFVTLKGYQPRRMEALIAELRDQFTAFADARIEVKEFEQGPPVDAPIAIRIIGDNLDVLQRLAQDVETIIAEAPGTVNTQNPLATPKTDLHVNINREKAGMLGVNLVDVDRTVRASISGLPVARFRSQEGKEHDIVLRLPFEDKLAMADFEKIHVNAVTGSPVPLHQLATVEFRASPTEISHYNLDRTVTLTSDVRRGVTVDQATKWIIGRLDAYDWPNGYRYGIAGELESREESFGGMAQAIAVAMIGIFGVLVLQFRSFSQPLIVFTAIPLAMIGAVLALFVTGNTFSFTAFVGLTSLVGIVVNNSIILVDYINQLRAEGMGRLAALREAGETRFMPIVLTTATTIGGLLPLTLQGGTMWAPMGWTIIGGLLASTVLTLIVVPVLYNIFTPENGVTVPASQQALPPQPGGQALAT